MIFCHVKSAFDKSDTRRTFNADIAFGSINNETIFGISYLNGSLVVVANRGNNFSLAEDVVRVIEHNVGIDNRNVAGVIGVICAYGEHSRAAGVGRVNHRRRRIYRIDESHSGRGISNHNRSQSKFAGAAEQVHDFNTAVGFNFVVDKFTGRLINQAECRHNKRAAADDSAACILQAGGESITAARVKTGYICRAYDDTVAIRGSNFVSIRFNLEGHNLIFGDVFRREESTVGQSNFRRALHADICSIACIYQERLVAAQVANREGRSAAFCSSYYRCAGERRVNCQINFGYVDSGRRGRTRFRTERARAVIRCVNNRRAGVYSVNIHCRLRIAVNNYISRSGNTGRAEESCNFYSGCLCAFVLRGSNQTAVGSVDYADCRKDKRTLYFSAARHREGITAVEIQAFDFSHADNNSVAVDVADNIARIADRNNLVAFSDQQIAFGKSNTRRTLNACICQRRITCLDFEVAFRFRNNELRC